MTELPQTPSATVGPYFSMKLKEIAMLGEAPVAGRRIRVVGRVLDGEQHIEDALIEVWQANAAGRYRHPGDAREDLALDDGFLGYARVHSDFKSGEYALETVKPGRVPDPMGGLQAPHLNLIVTARGMLNHSYTRLYFSDEDAANAEDVVLGQVPENRRPTLLAELTADGDVATYRFDIKFQGDDETVFFDI